MFIDIVIVCAHLLGFVSPQVKVTFFNSLWFCQSESNHFNFQTFCHIMFMLVMFYLRGNFFKRLLNKIYVRKAEQ